MVENKLEVQGINSKGFGTISKLVMQDRNLGCIAKALYAYFCSFAGGGSSCFPTRKKICFDLDISTDTYTKYLHQLVDNGYIQVQQIKENGRFSHNIYTINFLVPCPKIPVSEISVPGNLDPNINSNNINSINNISKKEAKGRKGRKKKNIKNRHIPNENNNEISNDRKSINYSQYK